MVDKNYLLIGLGVANLSVKRFFDRLSVNYQILPDDQQYIELDYKSFDFIIKSPGIKSSSPVMSLIRQQNSLIIGDLELFYLFYPQAIYISITGTNGKTTVTTLIYQLLKERLPCHVAGNIGFPLFDLQSDINFVNELVIIEVSSYMLDSIITFHPNCHLILNVTPHHLDYHGNFLSYQTAKIKPLKNMSKEDLVLINDDITIIDDSLNVINYCHTPLFEGFKVKNDGLYFGDENFYTFKNTPFEIYHNRLNLRAALWTCSNYHLTIEEITNAIEKITLPPFRMEKIFDDGSTVVYNDSKATTLKASFSAILSLVDKNVPIIWIAGGVDILGEYDFTPLMPYNHLVYVISYNENSTKIARACHKNNLSFKQYKTLEELLVLINSQRIGKMIIFSPGFQSFDLYKNFEDRGRTFTTYIEKFFV